jgi:hypothetical protein
MFNSSQNFYSPNKALGSPVKGNVENSPLSSPLKQPRPIAGYDKGYTPISKADIIGVPIEIIQGK